METPGRLACGLCGFTTVASVFASGPGDFTTFFRAVYCVGPDEPYTPQLSGLGNRGHGVQRSELLVPREACQRWDDTDLPPGSLIHVRGVRPPLKRWDDGEGEDEGEGEGDEPHLTDEQRACIPWGFYFHDACWRLLEQAAAPQRVDVEALWRVLLSVPCGARLPNWGHTYGGLYTGMPPRESRNGFVLLGPNSDLVIPSTFADPFEVPELKSLVSKCRLDHRQENPDGAVDGSSQQKPQLSIVHANSIFAGYDPFAKLPLELRELLLAHIETKDLLNIRLASREIALTPLSQSLFQSRFWPGREFHFVFDAFVLRPAERRGTDWMALYREMKDRVVMNRVGLGERNRRRIWEQTAWPLVKALEPISRLSPLEGHRMPPTDPGISWKCCRSRKVTNPIAYGCIGRVFPELYSDIPTEGLTAIAVSLVKFFQHYYITGLRFIAKGREDIKLGYISEGSEEVLDIEGRLHGFFLAIDDCGLRGVALATDTVSEYLTWAGNPDNSEVKPLTLSNVLINRAKAEFDNFRMQGLCIASVT